MTEPVRVLHVVGEMNRGGTETWLLHVLRNIDREKFRFDFLVHTEATCAYDDELQGLGARVIRVRSSGNPVAYSLELLAILREYGPYDVVHSHVHYFSGLVMLVARLANVPIRLSHGHCDTRFEHRDQPIGRKAYRHLSRYLLNRFATDKLAVSEQAAADLFGEGADAYKILSPTVDLSRFGSIQDRLAARTAIGVESDEFVIGNVGRLIPVKNQVFLVKLLAEVIRNRTNAALLIAGEGPLRDALTDMAVALGLENRVRLIGPCDDIPRFLAALDVFVMPSLSEGFGLAAVEAQAAGIPTILSDRIPRHVDLGAGMTRFLSLDVGLQPWVETICHFVSAEHRECRAEFEVKNEAFSLSKNLAALMAEYGSGI